MNVKRVTYHEEDEGRAEPRPIVSGIIEVEAIGDRESIRDLEADIRDVVRRHVED